MAINNPTQNPTPPPNIPNSPHDPEFVTFGTSCLNCKAYNACYWRIVVENFMNSQRQFCGILKHEIVRIWIHALGSICTHYSEGRPPRTDINVEETIQCPCHKTEFKTESDLIDHLTRHIKALEDARVVEFSMPDSLIDGDNNDI